MMDEARTQATDRDGRSAPPDKVAGTVCGKERSRLEPFDAVEIDLGALWMR